MSELEDKISSILNDPGELSKIASMAQSLMGGGLVSESAPRNEKPSGDIIQSLMGSMGSLTGGGEKTAMLRALCPCLDEKRGKKLERAIRMSEMAQLARKFLKEQGGDGYGHE